jgi:hypothetical protein
VGRIELTHVQVGGRNVAFEGSGDASTVEIAGERFSAAQWSEIERRVNVQLQRMTGVANGNSGNPSPWERSSNAFLLENIQEVNGRTRGRIKKPIWPLSIFFDAVVTKEELRGYD